MVIETFNLAYFLLILLTVGLIVLCTLLMKNKTEKQKSRFLIGLCLTNVVLYVIYKFGLYFRTPGLPDSYTFNAWLELPLHLCNISLILTPIGIRYKNKMLLAYSFFIAPLGAFMAYTFPSEGFSGLNVFYFHMLGYNITHLMIIVIGVLVVSLGFFKPTFDKIPAMFLLAVVLSFLAFLVNVLLRNVVNVPANYFFTYEPEGISILELFWSILPVPYLYCIFAMVILAVYTILTTLPFYLIDKKKGKKMLKKVLLIGDSIREGYCPFVKEYLSDVADVRYPGVNNRYSQMVLMELAKSMSYFEKPEELDVVVFNTGHWDEGHSDMDEKSLNSLEVYGKMLERIYKRIKVFAPKAVLIFPLTSSLNRYFKGEMRMRNDETEKYNEVAIKVLTPLGVKFIDHYEFTKNCVDSDYLDIVHFTPEFNKKLGKFTADFIREYL